MIARSLTMGLALLVCLASGQIIRGQEGQREVPREQPKAAELTNVQRRLVELEKHLEVLIRELDLLRSQAKPAPVPAAKAEVKIFLLRNAGASEIAKVLRELHPKDEKIRIAVHQSTNSVIVRAATNELEEIEAIITRLDGIVTDTKKAKPRPEDGNRAPQQ